MRHSIDYLGAAVLAAGLSALVLFTSLGGTTYAWGSAADRGARASSALVLLVLFPFVEARAAEPILPLELFRNRVFSVTSAIGFIVGFALFGAVTYLPLYLQIVKGHTPTQSGLLLVPLMAGVLVTSILSGNLISKFGRYRPFPIAGTAIMTVGMLLLSLLVVDTPTWHAAVFMLILGLGLGMTMQVLVLAAQNSVDFRNWASRPRARRSSARSEARSASRSSARSSRTGSRTSSPRGCRTACTSRRRRTRAS